MSRSSVSCRISHHSEIDWAVRKWQILNKLELSETSNSILKAVLLLVKIYYFKMNTGKSKLKGLSNNRLGSMIFLLRMAGIPLKMEKISTMYAIYMRTVIICASTSYLGMCFDVYIHWDDLGRAMTTMRVLIPITNVMWIFSSTR